MQQKDARFQARCRVFAMAAGTANHSSPKWCTRHEVFPAMVRVRWQRMGTNVIRRWGHGRSGATKSQHPKTGHGIADPVALLVGAAGDGCAAVATSARRRAPLGFQKPELGSPGAAPDGFGNVHWRTMPACRGIHATIWNVRHPVGRGNAEDPAGPRAVLSPDMRARLKMLLAEPGWRGPSPRRHHCQPA